MRFYTDDQHRIRDLEAEVDTLRYALTARADALLGEEARAEAAHSALWFKAFEEKAKECRLLRAELHAAEAKLKEQRRGP